MWIFPQVKTRYDLGVFAAGAKVHDKIALFCVVWRCSGTFLFTWIANRAKFNIGRVHRWNWVAVDSFWLLLGVYRVTH